MKCGSICPLSKAAKSAFTLRCFPKPEEIFAEDPRRVLDEWKQLFAVFATKHLRVLEEAAAGKADRQGTGGGTRRLHRLRR